jgi:hypothetical protein
MPSHWILMTIAAVLIFVGMPDQDVEPQDSA